MLRVLQLVVVLALALRWDAEARSPTKASHGEKAKAEAKRLGLAARDHGGAGRYPESIESSLQAIDLDPSSYSYFSDLSYTFSLVHKQSPQEQQKITQRLADARAGHDASMPFVPALGVVYSPSTPILGRAVVAAKLGVKAACSAFVQPVAGFATSLGNDSSDLNWLGIALDVVLYQGAAKAPVVQNCMSALGRVASSADNHDPLVSFVAGRLSLAIGSKFNHSPSFPDLFNCGKGAVALTVDSGATFLGDSRGARFPRLILPVALAVGDVVLETSVGPLEGLEVARKLFVTVEGSELLTGLSLPLRAKLVRLGGKMCCDRAISMQPRNLLGYLTRGRMMSNLDSVDGAMLRGLADFRTLMSLIEDSNSQYIPEPALQAGIVIRCLAKKLIREKITLAEVSEDTTDVVEQFTFNASVLVDGVHGVAQSRFVTFGQSNHLETESLQTMSLLSNAELISELTWYANKLDLKDPRTDLLRAMHKMTAAEAQQSSGVELDGEAKAELHRSVDRHADKALVAFGLLTEQQRAVLGQEAEQVEWRVWELKASAVQTFGGADSERHIYKTTELRPDGKTWTFQPSAISRAWENAAEAIERRAGALHDTVANFYTNAARMMWLHKLIVPRGYNGWVGDQNPARLEIAAKDVSTPPHQSEMWKRVSQNYGRALQHQPTNAESFVGKLFADGEWLDRWQRFHQTTGTDGQVAVSTAPPESDQGGSLPAGAFLAGDSFRHALSKFYNTFHSQLVDEGNHIASSLRFVVDVHWTKPTNQPIDEVAVEEAITNAPGRGLVLEFGVFEATTIRDLSLYMEQRNHEMNVSTRRVGTAEGTGAYSLPTIIPPFLTDIIHGFDSFEGLPHDWDGRAGMKAGHFSLGGSIPRVFIESIYHTSAAAVEHVDGMSRERNVHLHKGWFNETLPAFLRRLPKEDDGADRPVALVHMDCNLYTSTSTVLRFLRPHLVPGSVIWFDDYLMTEGWQHNENKAWSEFVEEHQIKFEWVAFGYMGVVVRIIATNE